MEKARLEAYISPDTKSKLKMFALMHQVTISKLIDDIINDWIDNCNTDDYPLGGDVNVKAN